MYYDVQPRAQSVMRMCDVGRRRKRVILLVIEEKRRGRTSPFFYPQVYTERCRERDRKKKPKRERETKRFEILKRTTRV